MTGHLKCFSVSQRSCSDCRFKPYSTGNSNFSAALLQQLDRLGVGDALEWPFDDEIEPSEQFLVDELGEEVQLLRAVLANVPHQIFHDFLRQIHVALQIGKGHLRLDHPELVRVARGIRVFGAKGRTKRVDFRQRAGERFGFELSAHREIGGRAEEILRNQIEPSGLRAGSSIDGGDAKQFARAFAVAGGDDRRVDVEKPRSWKKW